MKNSKYLWQSHAISEQLNITTEKDADHVRHSVTKTSGGEDCKSGKWL